MVVELQLCTEATAQRQRRPRQPVCASLESSGSTKLIKRERTPANVKSSQFGCVQLLVSFTQVCDVAGKTDQLDDVKTFENSKVIPTHIGAPPIDDVVHLSQ